MCRSAGNCSNPLDPDQCGRRNAPCPVRVKKPSATSLCRIRSVASRLRPKTRRACSALNARPGCDMNSCRTRSSAARRVTGLRRSTPNGLAPLPGDADRLRPPRLPIRRTSERAGHLLHHSLGKAWLDQDPIDAGAEGAALKSGCRIPRHHQDADGRRAWIVLQTSCHRDAVYVRHGVVGEQDVGHELECRRHCLQTGHGLGSAVSAGVETCAYSSRVSRSSSATRTKGRGRPVWVIAGPSMRKD